MQNVKLWLSQVDSLIATTGKFITTMIDSSADGVNASNTARNHAIVGVLIALSIIYPHTPLTGIGEANRALFNVVIIIIYALFARSLVMTFVLWLKTE